MSCGYWSPVIWDSIRYKLIPPLTSSCMYIRTPFCQAHPVDPGWGHLNLHLAFGAGFFLGGPADFFLLADVREGISFWRHCFTSMSALVLEPCAIAVTLSETRETLTSLPYSMIATSSAYPRALCIGCAGALVWRRHPCLSSKHLNFAKFWIDALKILMIA